MKISVEEKKKLINKQNLSYRFKVNKLQKNFLRSIIKETQTMLLLTSIQNTIKPTIDLTDTW